MEGDFRIPLSSSPNSTTSPSPVATQTYLKWIPSSPSSHSPQQKKRTLTPLHLFLPMKRQEEEAETTHIALSLKFTTLFIGYHHHIW